MRQHPAVRFFVSRLLSWPRRRRRPEAVIDRAYAGWVCEEDRCPNPGVSDPGGPQAGVLLSIVMPVRDPPVAFLGAAIGSVLAQFGARWELCIADDGSTSPDVRRLLQTFDDRRIRSVTLPQPVGIAAATNAALALASGAFVGFMDHDDVLAADALACVAAAIADFPDCDMMFSDEDQLVGGRRASPYFKPGWNPDLMLAQNVVGHLAVYRRTLLARLGGLREGIDGSQDHDLALRACALTNRIRHLPRVLYHWRQDAGSFSSARNDACRIGALRAVSEFLGDASVEADAALPRVEADAALPQWNRVVHPLPASPPRVWAVVSGEGAAPIDPEYPSVRMVREADLHGVDGDAILLFVAAGLRAAHPGWLRELVSQARRPGIGCVGGRLDAPGGSVAHAGYVLDTDCIAQSLHPRSDPDDPGYRGQFGLARTVSAVSEHCLAMRALVFRDAGGFDPRAGRWRSVDLCLRLASSGLHTVWTPYARLRYAAVPTEPARDPAADAMMRTRWGPMLANDPYANPNLAVQRGTYALRRGYKARS